MTRLGGRLLVRRADLRAAGLLGRNRLVGRQSFIWSAIDLPVGIALLARNRLTRTAAERRFVLSGECGQGQFSSAARLETRSFWQVQSCRPGVSVIRVKVHSPPPCAPAPGGVCALQR
jgi:hypothetical protein